MAIDTKEGVIAAIEEHRGRLKDLGVSRLGLFGSFARGQAHTESDVDVLFEFEEGRKTFDNFMQLAFLLEDLFGRRVDLVTRESLSPYIAPSVLSEIEYASLTPSLSPPHHRRDRVPDGADGGRDQG